MTWALGEATVRGLLVSRRLESVPANERHAQQLVEQAEAALAVAHLAADAGYLFNAVSEAWEAARKALTAPLAWQGLRPTAAGGHRVVIEVAEAQFGSAIGPVLRPAARLKRRRNDVEYPDVDAHIDAAETADLLAAAQEIVTAVPRLLVPELGPFR